jgi:hypothetical protein
MKQDDILKYVKEHYPGHAIMLMTGFESAFIGITEEGYRLPCAVYDFGKCVEILMDTEQMTSREAMAHLHEIIELDMGEYAPYYTNTFSSFFNQYNLN